MEKGIYKDNRGRKIQVVCTDLPGKYPLLGVQLTNSGQSVSKGGLRLYTASGKFYANGKSKVDPLDLIPTLLSEGTVCGDCECEEDVTLAYYLNGKEVARQTVKEGSDEYEELTENGWTEAEEE